MIVAALYDVIDHFLTNVQLGGIPRRPDRRNRTFSYLFTPVHKRLIVYTLVSHFYAFYIT